MTNESKTDNTNGVQKHSKAIVYSFFHRGLAPMANNVVELLRSCNAHIDPNLLSLAPKGDKTKKEESSRSKRKRQRKQESNREDVGQSEDVSVEIDDNEFAALQPNQIVLKRASHVSDAESSDSEDAQ